MASDRYARLLEQARDLEPQELRRLRDGITALLDEPEEGDGPFDIMDLEGLGAHVRRERESWDG